MDQRALITLWNATQMHLGTSGAKACAGVLLGLYNGQRFPMDLTDLRLLDEHLLQAAVDVIHSDATRCQRDFGQRFEHLAHEYACFKKGRSKTAYLQDIPVSPAHLVIRLTEEKEAA